MEVNGPIIGGWLDYRVFAAGGWFVGVANPQAKSFFNQVVDTDDDFGLLRLEDEALVFEGFLFDGLVIRTLGESAMRWR